MPTVFSPVSIPVISLWFPHFPALSLFLPPLDSHQCDLALIKAAESHKIQALCTPRPLSKSASRCIIKALHSLSLSAWHEPLRVSVQLPLVALHHLKILSESNTITAYRYIYIFICISISCYLRNGDFECSLFLKYWGSEPYLEADSLFHACCWSDLFSWLPARHEHFGSLLQ